MAGFGASGITSATFSVADDQNSALGTAFCVNIMDSSRSGTFLLTAGHAVRLAQSTLRPVGLVSAEGKICSGLVLACNEERYPDVGLVYAEERLAEPVACTALDSPGPVIIRGCPSGVVTQQANMRGWLSGSERIGADEYLDIVLPDLSIIEDSAPANRSPEARSRAFPVLRGLSGAPVGVPGDDESALITGMVVRRNTGGIANRVYALPIRPVRDYLSRVGFTLQLHQRLSASGALAGALAGRLVMRLLQSRTGMHELWEEISGLFYQGLPMDDLLRSVIQSPAAYRVGGELAVSELEFLLARLIQKRGRQREAMALLRSAGAAASTGRSAEHQRLSALVQLRELGGSSFKLPSGQRRLLFDQAIGRYEGLADVPEEERAYEVASVVGVEAAHLSNSESFMSGEAKAHRYFLEMTEKHKTLVSEYPGVLLEKQEVVQLMLQMSSTLWGLKADAGPSERSEEILNIAAQGSRAALQRANGIFYCQMIIAQAVAARMGADDHLAFFLAGLAASALAASGLTLDHEGLSALRGYIKIADPLLGVLLSAVLRQGASLGISSVIDGPYEMSRSEREALVEASRRLRQVAPTVLGVGDLLRISF
jgi:hypothetical protein